MLNTGPTSQRKIASDGSRASGRTSTSGSASAKPVKIDTNMIPVAFEVRSEAQAKSWLAKANAMLNMRSTCKWIYCVHFGNTIDCEEMDIELQMGYLNQSK